MSKKSDQLQTEIPTVQCDSDLFQTILDFNTLEYKFGNIQKLGKSQRNAEILKKFVHLLVAIKHINTEAQAFDDVNKMNKALILYKKCMFHAQKMLSMFVEFVDDFNLHEKSVDDNDIENTTVTLETCLKEVQKPRFDIEQKLISEICTFINSPMHKIMSKADVIPVLSFIAEQIFNIVTEIEKRKPFDNNAIARYPEYSTAFANICSLRLSITWIHFGYHACELRMLVLQDTYNQVIEHKQKTHNKMQKKIDDGFKNHQDKKFKA